MDPVIQEIQRARAGDIRPDVFRRWARYLREQIQPQLDELAELKQHPQAAKAPSKKKETV